ncbi:MAG: RNA methyltransferase [Dehalococcoidia bacterium]|nr:RNA methyltransferase [Dehalococcoidia bacterium]
MPTERRVERMREVAARRQLDLQVVVDHVHDPHNASAILRTSDGFGLQTINLLYEQKEFPEISNPVAAYTKRWMTLRQFSDARTLVDTLHAEGMRVLATNLAPGTIDYREVDWTQPHAVVFGNEHRGCTEEVIALADANIAIPMIGFAQSFNVSVSAGIILSEAFRQRSAAGMYRDALEEMDEPHRALWDEWTQREIRRELRQDR